MRRAGYSHRVHLHPVDELRHRVPVGALGVVGQPIDVLCSGGGCLKLRRGGVESTKVLEDVPHRQVALVRHDRPACAEAGGSRDEVAVRDLENLVFGHADQQGANARGAVVKATVRSAIQSSRSWADGEPPMLGRLPALGASIQSPDDDEGPHAGHPWEVHADLRRRPWSRELLVEAHDHLCVLFNRR